MNPFSLVVSTAKFQSLGIEKANGFLFQDLEDLFECVYASGDEGNGSQSVL